MRRSRWLPVPLLVGIAGLVAIAALYRTPKPILRREAPDARRLPPETAYLTLLDRAPRSSQEPTGALGETPLSRSALREKEKDYFELFRRIALERPEELDRVAAEVLAGTGSDCEKLGLLKALKDLPSPEVLRHFRTALHAGPMPANVALRFLEKRAAADPVTRAFLESQVWGEPWTAGPELRRKTVRTLFTFATRDEASRLSSRLLTETDADLVAEVAPALRRFGLLEGLAWSHPDVRVRARLEAMLLPTPQAGETADASVVLAQEE